MVNQSCGLVVYNAKKGCRMREADRNIYSDRLGYCDEGKVEIKNLPKTHRHRPAGFRRESLE